MPNKDQARAPANRGQKAFCLSRNIIAYATGMELPKPKLTRTVIVDGADGGIARSKFRALQLQYISDESLQPPPAADALRNLMAYLEQNAKLDVAKTSEVLAPSSPLVTKYKFMYLHGRKPFTLEGDGLESIKSNLQTGGLLLADAGCNGFDAWQKFDASFRKACKDLFPDSPLQVIPANYPLLGAKMNGGAAITSIRCRRERTDGKGPEAEMRNYAPYLEGVKVDGRWVIVYSKYDIGCALEGHKAADCLGHDKESALKLGSAVVLYSLKR